jgi:uncharacterized peroxidase-related enzyme
MSRIPAVDSASTTNPVKSLLDGVQKGLGATPNMFKVAANSPSVLEALVSFFGAVGKGHLNAKTREAIALTVSEIDGCDYCLSAHSAFGKGAGLTDADLDQARSGAASDPKLAATLAFARRIVEKRGHLDEDLAAIRRAGLSDAEILEVIANVGLTTFTNYLNDVTGTDIDFPRVSHRPR